jgi:actin-related protein 10
MPADLDELDNADLMDRLRCRYAPGADATDIRISTAPLPHETQGMGPATLVVPGWVRERAAEVLFDNEEGEAESIPDLLLHCISKVSRVIQELFDPEGQS